MIVTRRDALAGIALTPLLLDGASAGSSFRDLAPTPPMGWNSWDSFGPAIREDEAHDVARVMAGKLLPHGYDIFTIDIQWYEPGADSYDYRKGARLAMDAWGRLVPAANRFPSAADGAGFKALADSVHGLGLKFGIHVMRGVPRQAADANAPIQGTSWRAGDIADRTNVCPWNTDMYGIDMSKPGAQAYYDSIARLYASWGVDFIKADDMSRPYFRNAPEIHALRRAIDGSGRPMTLSLSPGATPLAAAGDVVDQANMWRISDDFWDSWPALLAQFDRLRDWAPFRHAGNWPDADMLPLGLIDMGRRRSRLTADEQRTLMTLWSIARSPLIMGGDLRALDAATLALLTNDEVLAVNQASADNRETFSTDGFVAWRARALQARDFYVALFNRRDTSPDTAGASVPFHFAQLGIEGPLRVRDLWERRDLGTVENVFAPVLPCHGAGLYRLSPA